MALNDYFHGSEVPQHFPLPARPTNAYEYENNFESNTPEIKVPNFIGEYKEEEEETSVSNDDIKTLKGLLEEMDESLKKLVSKMGKKFKLERFIKETLQEHRGDTFSDMVEKLREKLKQYVYDDSTNMERGVDLDSRSIGEETDLKMERFKVKTLNLGGVAKQEQKK